MENLNSGIEIPTGNPVGTYKFQIPNDFYSHGISIFL